MKKIIAPFVYIIFAVPVFSGFFTLLSALEDLFQFLGLSIVGMIITFVATNVSVFWLANILLHKIDPTTSPHLLDHLRQSIFFYCIFIVANVFFWPWWKKYPLSSCTDECHGYAIAASFILIPLFAILTNGLYLIRQRKVSIT